MHRVEKILPLCVDANAQLLAFKSQPVFKVRSSFTSPRCISNDNHSKLSLNYGLVNINDATTRLGKDLRNACHDAGMIQAKDRNDYAIRRSLASPAGARSKRNTIR